MPYREFTLRQGGKTYYAIQNRRNGNITRFKSKAARKKGIQIREAFSHGWKPKGLANASYPTRQRVSSMGGRARNGRN